MNQTALFVTICLTCNGQGYVPEEVDGRCTGWADPCPDCTPNGERHYDPHAADIPY